MNLMNLLSQELQKEIEGTQTPPNVPDNAVELLNHLFNKKMSDMELRLKAEIEKLHNQTEQTQDSTEVEQKGEQNDSNTELSVGE